MAALALKRPLLPYKLYKAFEDEAEERHIFWDGEIYAMSDASDDHNTIEPNIAGALYVALRGRPCRASTGNRRLRALHSDQAVYPDAVVICGPSIQHPRDAHATTNPTVIFEVLSKTTRDFDRGDKFAYYRSFPSVMEVVFVEQDRIGAERCTRAPDGSWIHRELGSGEDLVLSSVDVRVPLDDLYEGTALRPAV